VSDAEAHRWQVEPPPSRAIDTGDMAGLGPWFTEVWALRGGVFYEDGRRPGFDLSGKRLDPDPLDFHAYHILAHARDGLVGCVRVLPLASAQVGLTELLVGRDRFEQVLGEIGASRRHTVEVGRLAVRADRRARGLGGLLSAAAWALSRHLGCRTVVAPAGTADGQDRMLAKIGLRPVPGIETRRSELFADEVRVMYAPLEQPTDGFRSCIDQMARTLDLRHG